ncbi:MAG TPA: tRNA (pseudouridine(54)-N(1))-methyltransferase TrmY [Candidatus Nanoarchaeia archaeon]|nr:tRNA (pseudouridine(54)-N(1))-methyltransferase TrmY [Candidatus Nanoarchaeia archaeon]
MREFIVYALKARTTPDFQIEDLPGAGRMDIVCEVILNALFISNAMRRDTLVHVAMTGPRDPPKLVTFSGAALKGLNPDACSIAKMIQKALDSGRALKLNEEKEISPGVTIAKKAFEPLVKEKAQASQLIYLDPDGKDIRNVSFEKNVTFVLGDYIGLPRNTEKLLNRVGAQKIKLGPQVLFAAQCPILVHNQIDRQDAGW